VFPHAALLQPSGLARAGLLPTYLLLAVLLVVIPTTARELARASLPRIRALAGLRLPLEVVLAAALLAALTYAWTQSAPILIRPAYTWRGSLPSIDAIQPVQATGWFLVFLAVLVGGARPLLQLAAQRRDPRSVVPVLGPP